MPRDEKTVLLSSHTLACQALLAAARAGAETAPHVDLVRETWQWLQEVLALSGQGNGTGEEEQMPKINCPACGRVVRADQLVEIASPPDADGPLSRGIVATKCVYCLKERQPSSPAPAEARPPSE